MAYLTFFAFTYMWEAVHCFFEAGQTQATNDEAVPMPMKLNRLKK